MLKYRILTALFLIPILITLIITLPPVGFFIFTTFFLILGALEWTFFMGLQKPLHRVLYICLMFLILIASLHIPITLIFYAALVWWLIGLGLVLCYPKLATIWGKSIFLRGLMGVMVLVPCIVAINFIRDSNEGVYNLLFLFVLIWAADTGAYFVGKKWGKNKLASAVSPGKTWEGLGGGLVLAMIVVLCLAIIYKAPHHMWPALILLSFITVLFSVLGDLFESMLKRNAGLKDSGRLLPGHGGILDRIDSLTAAAPILALGETLLGKIFQ